MAFKRMYFKRPPFRQTSSHGYLKQNAWELRSNKSFDLLKELSRVDPTFCVRPLNGSMFEF